MLDISDFEAKTTLGFTAYIYIYTYIRTCRHTRTHKNIYICSLRVLFQSHKRLSSGGLSRIRARSVMYSKPVLDLWNWSKHKSFKWLRETVSFLSHFPLSPIHITYTDTSTPPQNYFSTDIAVSWGGKRIFLTWIFCIV